MQNRTELKINVKAMIERMRLEKLNGTDTAAHYRRNRLLSTIQSDANSQLSFEEMNAAITSRTVGTGSLNRQREAIVSVFRQLAPLDMKIANIVSEIDSCLSYRKCNSKYCPKCSHVSQGWVKGCSAKLSKNYQFRSGQRISEPFDGLPPCFIHVVTVNLGFIPISENLSVVSKQFKKRLKQCQIELSDGSIIAGRLDVKMMYLDEVTFTIPNTAKEDPYGPSNKHERVAVLHADFLVFDPSLTRQQVKDVLADEFPGSERVCVRAPYNDRLNADGTVTKVPSAYAKYISMEKTEFDFGQDNLAALIEFTGIDGTWDGRNKGISFGKRSDDTETLLNRNILQDYSRNLEGKSVPKNMPIRYC